MKEAPKRYCEGCGQNMNGKIEIYFDRVTGREKYIAHYTHSSRPFLLFRQGPIACDNSIYEDFDLAIEREEV